jgi:hypothetical protein
VEEFSWEQYLAMSGSQAASRSVFAARGHVVSHGFVAGMRLECADLMDPRLVCVATIARVVADLLKVTTYTPLKSARDASHICFNDSTDYRMLRKNSLFLIASLLN